MLICSRIIYIYIFKGMGRSISKQIKCVARRHIYAIYIKYRGLSNSCIYIYIYSEPRPATNQLGIGAFIRWAVSSLTDMRSLELSASRRLKGESAARLSDRASSPLCSWYITCACALAYNVSAFFCVWFIYVTIWMWIKIRKDTILKD